MVPPSLAPFTIHGVVPDWEGVPGVLPTGKIISLGKEVAFYYVLYM